MSISVNKIYNTNDKIGDKPQPTCIYFYIQNTKSCSTHDKNLKQSLIRSASFIFQSASFLNDTQNQLVREDDTLTALLSNVKHMLRVWTKVPTHYDYSNSDNMLHFNLKFYSE